MRDFKDRVAVVTGAASGIGRALAQRCANEGMKVVLADIEPEPLNVVAKELSSEGAAVIAVPTDVSKADDVEHLAEETLSTFGGIHILCNNAGVGAGGPMAELKACDWQWVLGVNLWGVINGITSFLPRMLAGGEEGHIVNTASLAGLVSAPFMAPYNASKFAVVAITESLFHELAMMKSKVGTSVLCPGWVNTNIYMSERNRPSELGGGTQEEADDPRSQLLRGVLQAGLDPSEVATQVFDAIQASRLYIITHPDMLPAVEQRMRAILNGKNPELTFAM